MAQGIYIASKAKHGPKWQKLRASGINIISTWIDESEEGQTANWDDLWHRIKIEIKNSQALIFYNEENEIQKGALVEIGIAIGFDVPIFYVGPKACTVQNTNFVTVCESLNEAINLAKIGK